jgi:hypothetical protein
VFIGFPRCVVPLLGGRCGHLPHVCVRIVRGPNRVLAAGHIGLALRSRCGRHPFEVRALFRPRSVGGQSTLALSRPNEGCGAQVLSCPVLDGRARPCVAFLHAGTISAGAA